MQIGQHESLFQTFKRNMYLNLKKNEQRKWENLQHTKKYEEKHKIALILRDKSKFRLFEIKQKKNDNKKNK